MVVSFDPMVPYIYLPKKQWANYANIMMAYYGNMIKCDDIRGLCKFVLACDEIRAAQASNDLILHVSDFHGFKSTIKL
jgi:hypothetical protein